MSTQLIRPARTLQGSLTLPGDKSISHRYALLAGLAEGTTRLANFSTGADPHSSLSCIAALGATVTQTPTHIEIIGTGGHFHQPKSPLDCGNSGSTMRMLAGLIAPHPHTFTLTGDESLTARPMERIRKPLTQMGANLQLTEGHAPITIQGGLLRAIDFETPIPSAQVKTAVLFAGLQASGTTSLAEAILTRDHSEHALRAFGATLTTRDRRLYIPGGQRIQAIEATVPGDLSSAAFFLCAALLFPDSNLILDAVGMNPTRSALLDVVAALGAKIRILNVEEHHGELVGTLQITGPAKPPGMYKSQGAPSQTASPSEVGTNKLPGAPSQTASPSEVGTNKLPGAPSQTASPSEVGSNKLPGAPSQTVSSSEVGTKPLTISGSLTAQLIDELPVLAAIAPYTRSGIIIRDAAELRVKESDRIALVAKNLSAMGATFTEHPDGLTIPGNQTLHGATIDSGNDHRIAMAFSIAALRATSETQIQGAEAAAISFPEFFTHLQTLCPA